MLGFEKKTCNMLSAISKSVSIFRYITYKFYIGQKNAMINVLYQKSIPRFKQLHTNLAAKQNIDTMKQAIENPSHISDRVWTNLGLKRKKN